MTFTEDDKHNLKQRIISVLETTDPDDELSAFVRGRMNMKAYSDWNRSKHRAGLTLDERFVLDENYDGPHENWRWHLYHVDPEVWRFITFCHTSEYEPLTSEELILDYSEYAIEQGLVVDDPGARLDILVGQSMMLKAKRGPGRMVIITKLTSQGKVMVEKYIDDEDRWTAPVYIDPDDLYEEEAEDEDSREACDAENEELCAQMEAARLEAEERIGE